MSADWTVASSSRKMNKSCKLCDKSVSSAKSAFCVDHLCPACFDSKKSNFKVCFNCHRSRQYETDSKTPIDEAVTGKSEQCQAYGCTIFTYNTCCPVHLCECGQRKTRNAYRCAKCADEKFPTLKNDPTPLEQLFFDYSMLRALLVPASGDAWTNNYEKPLNKAFLVRFALVIRYMELIRHPRMPRVTDDDVKAAITWQFRGLVAPIETRLKNIKKGLKALLREFDAPETKDFAEVINALDKNLEELKSYKVKF